MRSIRVGISGPGDDPARWSAALDCVELPRAGPGRPTLAQARAWRAAVPPAFEFVLRATPWALQAYRRQPSFRGRGTQSIAIFGDSATVRRSWKETVEIARGLGASLVIFPTPASFRPAEVNVARMTAFFDWAHRDGLRLGWEPRNKSWPDEDLARLCRELSLTHVVDPLRRRPARGRPPCYRLNGVGGPGHRYGDDELSEIMRRCEAHGANHPMYDDNVAYCLFGNASRWEDACRLRGLIQRSKADP